ncbi:hypothetical protein GCM10017673_10960 [Streptosporangium violaceochromogenes]|nr:hypothetical protein GCM10017673_10960 [Streptosporangium violaceochromogenes]
MAGTVVLSLGVLGFTAPVPAGDRNLRPGDYAKAVERLQRRLQKLTFSPGLINGYYGSETQVAVWAFQRSQGLTPGDEFGRDDWRALAHPRVLAPLVAGGRSRRVEIDLRRRLLTVYRDRRPSLTSHVVTGDGTPFCQYGLGTSPTTPAGDFRVVRRVDRATADPLIAAYETFSFRSDPSADLRGGVKSAVRGGLAGMSGETTIGLAGEPLPTARPLPTVRPAPTARPLPTARPVLGFPGVPGARPVSPAGAPPSAGPTPTAGPAPTVAPAPPAYPVSGCVRVPAHVAERLYRLVKVGDPVHVRRSS